ncbi:MULTISPECIES: hypothetical protein [unclassified Thermosynechococcus]|uniref:hypothetical protein n=1 Tax=unclassified Thermosynechococcus TaxID=2622553 RepID=UPI00267134FC|nr:MULTISPECIES: hypothetical protein [unclassified Thermosynechococcus]WKT82596.1 hypothetical protein QYC28_07095 [Thermosynechococcus sp. HY596]WNC61722.1 hypothetical protein RHK13_07090 [Thermosynechococcus sp. HY591]WNC64276.1 hypothetical protein RHK28_07125 [Thermosynechococcus sp. HY593]
MTVAASWSVGILIVSAIAALSGLSWLLYTAYQEEKQCPLREYSPQEAYSETLWRMIFVYWLVYCGARGLQIAVPLEGTDLGQMCKITALLAFLLTTSSLLCLPMHYWQARQRQQQLN